MKILIITASLPYPPASGGAIRVYGIVKGLSTAGHEVTLLAFGDKTQAIPAPLAEVCAKVNVVDAPSPRSKTGRLKTLMLSRQPDIAERLYSDEMVKALAELLRAEQFDIIQIEAIETACYLPLAKAGQPNAKLIFDTFNAEYLLQRAVFHVDRAEFKRWPAALYSWIQSRRIARFEREMCRLADAVIAVSPEDADALRGFRDDRAVHIVPSGIFVDEYQVPTPSPSPYHREGEYTPTHSTAQHHLVFTGKMDYRPNVDAMLWFAEDVLPLIQREIPDVRLVIVGQQPHARLDGLRQNPAITLTGWVDSVLPYLHDAGVYVAPLRMGSGTRLKLLEAMARGCAIVATSTAAAGLTDEVKRAMCIADDASAFARTVVNLLGDQPRRAMMGREARQAIHAHYDWSAIMPRLLDVYTTLTLKEPPRG